jgi:hypothetical protein
MPKAEGHLNLNTVLIGIVLALSGWTLKTVSDGRVETATIRARVEQHHEAINGLNSRVGAVERSVGDLHERIGVHSGMSPVRD